MPAKRIAPRLTKKTADELVAHLKRDLAERERRQAEVDRRIYRTRRAARAFTLIELLIVIAIIAVLISLLLPAMAHARASARDAECRASLGQIGTAMRAFQADHKLRWPNGWTDLDIDPLYCPLESGTPYVLAANTPGMVRPLTVAAAEDQSTKDLQYASDPMTIRHGLRSGEPLDPNPFSAQWTRTWRNKFWLKAECAGKMTGPLSDGVGPWA